MSGMEASLDKHILDLLTDCKPLTEEEVFYSQPRTLMTNQTSMLPRFVL